MPTWGILSALDAAMTGKTPSRLARAIVQFFNCLIDARLCRGADVRLAVDHTRHCFYRDARKLGDIKNGSLDD